MVMVLPIHFGVVFDCKGGGGEETKIGPEKFFRCRHSKQSYRPDIPPCQGLKVFFGMVLGCKGGGGKKKLLRRRKVCFYLAAPRQGSIGKTSQDKPKTSQGQHLKSDGL